jgi:aminodeoxyfutalosine deaminase
VTERSTLRASTAPAGVLEAFVHALPKVELHVHLEGTFRPATLLGLARRHGVHLPADDEEGLGRWFRYRGFEHFVEVYLACSSCLLDPEDFHRLGLDFLEEQSRQNVLWSEVHFTVSTHLARGLEGEAIAEALAAASAEGERRLGTSVRWIPDVVRNMPAARAEATLGWALENRARGVVALGAAGIEAAGNAVCRGPFEEAARQGLRRSVHAGEQCGPDSVRAAIDELGAERVGHGIRAVGDPALVRRLVESGVPLEVCPTSNVRLGLVDSMASHPFEALRAAGVEVSVGSDDPPFFGTTLEDEYLALARAFDYSFDQLADLARAGLRHAFATVVERRKLEVELERRMDRAWQVAESAAPP